MNLFHSHRIIGGRTACSTIGGPNPNAACVFPFKHNDQTYFGCPIDPEDSSKRWCSTKVDANGNHLTGQGAYGECGPSW